MSDRRSPTFPKRPFAASSRPPFSSGLTVPDFAACLDLGLQPVGLGAGILRHAVGLVRGGLGLHARASTRIAAGAQNNGAYVETYRCPHGFVSNEHRMWGQNLEQTWVEEAWSRGIRIGLQPDAGRGHSRSAPTA